MENREEKKMRKVVKIGEILLKEREGVFLVKMKNAFVPVKRVYYSVNTHSRISTVSQGSERAREQNELA